MAEDEALDMSEEEKEPREVRRSGREEEALLEDR